MKPHHLLKALLLLASLLPLGSQSQPDPADAILGTWLTTDEDGNRDSVVEIRRDNAIYSGVVRWIRYPHYPESDPMAGQVIVDRENPNPDRRDTPILGLAVLSGLKYSDEAWTGGHIYSVRSGKQYRARITLADRNTLKLRGYVGSPFLGSTVIWTRSPIPPEPTPAPH